MTGEESCGFDEWFKKTFPQYVYGKGYEDGCEDKGKTTCQELQEVKMDGWLFCKDEIGEASAAMSREQKYSDYAAFTEKFKGKKTTDDCYTPEDVYETVKKWVSENIMNLDGVEVVRPFYPGGDYEHFRYSENCVVLDNPPFSQLSKIRRFYNERLIRYFLFAPTLTLFSSANDGECFIVCGNEITYENGAKVLTSFVTNMVRDDTKIYVCGSLTARLQEIEDKRHAKKKRNKVIYPDCVVNGARLSSFAKKGLELKIGAGSVHRIDALDAQRQCGKSIFGEGFLLSESATKRLLKTQTYQQAQIYALSENEKRIQRSLI